MERPRHERVRALFLAALEQPPAERERFVTESAETDRELRNEVLELLDFAGTNEGTEPGNAADKRDDPRAFAAALPTKLGDYVLRSVLGKGGMGIVCRAEHVSSQRPVAIKMLFPAAAPPAIRERFRREVAALQRLDHPGIARVLETGIVELAAGPSPYFVMEFAEGLPLHEYVGLHRPPVTSRIELLVRLCDIVEHAHAHGVVHRDIKPENIRVTPDGRPMLVDFGLAQLVPADRTTAVTRIEQLIGTLRYMSPEQARAAEHIGPGSDVYSLGVVGFELLTGQQPYAVPADNIPAAIVAINTLQPRYASDLERALDERCARALAKALDKDPERRQRSAGELARELRAAATSPKRRSRLSKWRWIVAGALTVLVAGGAALVSLLRPPSIKGSVWSADGSQVQGARILAVDPSTEVLIASAESDEQGRFELSRLRTDIPIAIRARNASGFAATRLPSLRRGDRRPLELVLRELPRGLRGDSLVGWWPAEGDCEDMAGGHSGTVQLPLAYTPGPSGRAFLFEESHPGGVAIPDDRAFQMARVFTIEAWIRPTFAADIPGNELDGVFGKAAGCDRNNVSFSLTVGKKGYVGGIVFYMPDSTGLEIGISGPAAFIPQDGRFHHVAASFDGALVRIYVDGRLATERANPRVRSTWAGRVLIGHHPECASITAAAIDELRFFARALSKEEIAAVCATFGSADQR